MRKSEVANTFEIILIIMLFLSITVLMLNSFLPTIILRNTDNPEYLIYFNFESMKYSGNLVIQNLYNDVNLINNLIWITIIFIFIAFLGVILNISDLHKKISYLLLSIGCLSFIIISISCYLYYNFILKILNLNNMTLAYIILEPIKYPYFILILLSVILLISILYNIMTLKVFFIAYNDNKSKKQGSSLTKHFTKPIEYVSIIKNKKRGNKIHYYFNKKDDLTYNKLSNILKFNKEEDTGFKKRKK
jgi:hypothetical protein